MPDVVTPAVGRLAATLKATFEQAAPLEEALLQDLQLEHQLLDRATYVKVLAESCGAKVRHLAERLINAHKATVEWLTVVLAEEALGGPAALQPTPAAAGRRRARQRSTAPYRFVANRVNEALDTAAQRREQAGERLQDVADKASQFSGAVRETLTVGRGAHPAARRADRPPRGQPGRRRRRQAGPRGARRRDRRRAADQGLRLAVPADAVKAVKQLKTAHDLNVVIRYEETHKNRANVASAAQTQLAALAKEAVGIAD